MKSAAALAAVALMSGTTDAFWRMQCKSRTALARLDPIVDPGQESTHSHSIFGGSNFAETTTYDMLRESTCSSCEFGDDKSAYWTPSLHFVHDGGKVEVVPNVGGMLSYYLLLGENIKAFPAGFEMLAGDSRLRNFSGPVPDPPLAAWNIEDMWQSNLAQKAIGMNCLDYKRTPEGARFRHFLPDKEYLDQNCANGIRAEIFFPSCWNGKDITADDHQSHVAYPNQIDGGKCPEGFETRLPSLFYETIWDTNHFKGVPGQFVWSNGDPTGYGYHADFMNGWDIDTLQSAIDVCTNPSGMVSDCPIFTPNLQSEAEQGKCEIQEMPKILLADDCAGPAKGLCGKVPIQYGPEYAAPLEPGSPGKPVKPSLSDKAPVPTQSYAPARSEGPGGISIYQAKTDEIKPAAPSKAWEAPKEAPAAPAVTAAPAKQEVEDAANGNIVRTTTYTSEGIVYEIAVEEVAVTVTVTDEAAYPKHRRHEHAHARRHIGARH